MSRLFLNKYFLCFLLLAVAVNVCAQKKSNTVQTIEGKKFYIHKIEKGQSLYAISKLYAVNVEELYEYNPELKAGAKAEQEIKIPFVVPAPLVIPSKTLSLGTNTVTPPDSTKYRIHKVQKSETIYYLTRKYKISEKEILAFNPLLKDGVKEGQLLIVGEKNPKKQTDKRPKDVIQFSTAKENNVELREDSMLYKPVPKDKKQKYNISLMLPFSIDQTLAIDNNELLKTNSSFPEVPGIAIDFYLGFKSAIDSLSSKDFQINLELADIDDKDSTKLEALLTKTNFSELDIIFGPLYPSDFKTMSKKAKEFFVPIVSPITQQNKILYNNIYISKTNPSQFTLLEGLADYCIDSLIQNKANIILMTLHDKDKKEIAFVNAFRKYYNEKQILLDKGIADTVTMARSVSDVKMRYKPNVKNVIVSLSAHQVYVTDFVTQLAVFAEKKDIVLCGWQSITEMENIDQAYLNQLHYTFPHQFNFTNKQKYEQVINDYKTKLETYPSEYFFMGFDIAFYYLKNLKEYGPDFVHSLDTLNFESNYMRFKYARPDRTTGFDNRGLYIFRYNDFQIYNTGWK